MPHYLHNIAGLIWYLIYSTTPESDHWTRIIFGVGAVLHLALSLFLGRKRDVS
jgi:hypothetical protein